MNFKTWFLELTNGGEAEEQEPAQFAQALPGIFRLKDDPPKPVRTATKGYEVNIKRMRKYCKKA